MQKICKCEVEYGTASYLYRKNLFGDVTEIYNEAGTLVGKYSYTAFGVCTVELDTSGIATKNPIRYRSYYYDDETELYYLKSRYYDPEVGRFITIDDISYLAPDIINGLNLYAYCGNNPVMNVDPNGAFPVLGILALLFSAIVALLTGCSVSSVKDAGMQIVANVQNASKVKDAAEAVQSVVNFVNVLSDEEQLHFMHTVNVLGYAYYRHAFPVVYVSAFGGVPSNYTNRLENDYIFMCQILQGVHGLNIDELSKTTEGVREISNRFDEWALSSYFQMGVEIVQDALKYATDIYFYYMELVPGWGVIP